MSLLSKSIVASILAVLFFVAGCVQQTEVNASEIDGNSATGEENCKFNGPIDKESIKKVRKIVKKHDCFQLVISSFGGDAVASFELVDYLNEQEIKMIADDICFSACAQVLAALVDDLHINENTLLVFHVGFVEASTWLSGPDRAMSQSTSGLQALSRDYLARLKVNGGTTNFAYEPLLRTQPICVAPHYSVRGEPVFANVFSGWVPPRSWFEKFRGVDFTGYWPSDGDEYRTVVNRIKQEHHDFGLTAFGGPIMEAELSLSSQDLIGRIQSISICSEQRWLDLSGQIPVAR